MDPLKKIGLDLEEVNTLTHKHFVIILGSCNCVLIKNIEK